jgi:ABC-type sugar transport system permease subunit
MRLIFAVLITLLSIFYFLPFAIAFNRKRANTGAIFALNLFLGWSLIGWVIALVWALKEERLL